MFRYIVVAEVNATPLSPVSNALFTDGQRFVACGQSLLHPDPLTVNLVESVLHLPEFRFQLGLPEVNVPDSLPESGVDFFGIATSSLRRVTDT